MISFIILSFFHDCDRDNDFITTEDLAMAMAICEVLWSVLLVSEVQQGWAKADMGFIVLDAIICIASAFYLTFTPFMDWITGYVYSIVNYGMFVVIMIDGFVNSADTVNSVDNVYTMNPMNPVDMRLWTIISFVIYIIILIRCEYKGAFARGDTEFLLVSYCIISNSVSIENCLVIMLIIMLLSAFIFDIFRKMRQVPKEVMIPYTPFVSLSEFIIIIFIRMHCLWMH